MGPKKQMSIEDIDAGSLGNPSENPNENPIENPEGESGNEEAPARKKLSGSDFYKHKNQQTMSELSEQRKANAELKAKIEALQTQKLQEKENFKELWEREKVMRETAEQKAVKVETSFYNGLKMSAIQQEAIKLGIDERALEDLPLVENSMVEIETTSTGNANVLGAKEFVEALKENKPHWFKQVTAPNVSTGNPQGFTEKKMSASELIKIQKDDPAKYRAMMKRLYNIA